MIPLPPFLYGTAWKEAETASLVYEALNLGFYGIDTANQRKHYFEEAVGLGIQHYLKSSQKSREGLFLQSKFTALKDQDARLPYEAKATLEKQVEQSFASSLAHLQTDYLDSYVLHGPLSSGGLTEGDMEIWSAMETLVLQKKVNFLGISNVNLEQIKTLYEKARIKPSFVQNRCFASTLWDRDMRLFCKDNKIIYQGFSLLTANLQVLSKDYVKKLALHYDKTVPQIIFRFAFDIGILPLTGTTDPQHMKEDLSIEGFKLGPLDVSAIESIGVE